MVDAKTAKHYAMLRRKNFVAIPYRGSVTLSTLAANTVVDAALFDTVLGEDLFCISTDLECQLQGFTAAEGPLEFGMAHSDYSEGEVEEALSVSFFNPDNKIEQERARRAVRRIGAFPGLTTNEVFRDGTKYRQTLKFSVGNGFTVNLFVANRGPGTLTTGASVKFQGTMFGRWQR